MADQKISDMTLDTALTGTESIPMVDGGVNKKTTAQAIADLASGGATTLDALSDVIISGTPANGEVIMHNGSSWVNSGFGLDNLNDVAISSAAAGQELVRGSSGWINRTRHYVDVRDYGAVGDGVTNDRTAFQNAIATGKDVFVPIGTWLCTGAANGDIELTLNNNQNMFGTGATSIMKWGSNRRCVMAGKGSRISNLKFVGAGKAASQAWDAGVFLNIRAVVQNCIFDDVSGTAGTNGGGGIIGAAFDGGGDSTWKDGATITDCLIQNCASGINLMQRAEYVIVTNCKIVHNTTGVTNIGGNNLFQGCTITENTTGFTIASGTNNGHGACVNCAINHNSTTFTISDNAQGFQFTNCGFYGGSASITNCTGIRFFNCDFGSEGFGAQVITLTNNTLLLRNGCRFSTDPTNGTSVTLASGSNFTVVNDLDF